MKIAITKNTPAQVAAPITERIKTFDDACNVLGIDGEIFTGELNDAIIDDALAIAAFVKLVIITKALNEGWKPDWDNSNEYKHYAWWNMKKGFELYYVDCDYSYSIVSSRLCFKSESLAQYAATQFLGLYKEYMTIK